MTAIAVREGFKWVRYTSDRRSASPRDTSDLSTVLSQVLDSLFNDVENTAATWQRTRGSQPLPTFGKPDEVIDDSAVTDVRRLIDAFQLGYQKPAGSLDQIFAAGNAG